MRPTAFNGTFSVTNKNKYTYNTLIVLRIAIMCYTIYVTMFVQGEFLFKSIQDVEAD